MPPEREPKYPKYEWLGRDARRVRVRVRIEDVRAYLAQSRRVADELVAYTKTHDREPRA